MLRSSLFAVGSRLLILLSVLATCQAVASSEGASHATPAQEESVRAEFMAAMQRVHERAPEQPDSPALRAYVIYDYLIAARFRRDLDLKAGDPKPVEDLDGAIDAFLQAHTGQPVARNLRTDWLTSLANRHRWDWFLPRAGDVTSPSLICDR